MRIGRVLFMARNHLAALPMVYALFSTQWEWELPVATWSIAIGLATAGVVMRAWATCHCRYSTGQKKLLAFTGPYAHIRNPLYVGNILIILGGIVASELLWLLPVAALWALAVYSAVAAYEDGVMLAKFGDDYLRYRASVPAWIPALAGVPAAAPRNGAPAALSSAIVRQATNYLWLLPFVLKDLHVLGLGDGP
jgi:protein-S-isoprenylcysteine O-methyltransferase Ste14